MENENNLDNLDKFIEEIIDTKQLPGITSEVKNQIHADLKSRLLEQINVALVRALDESKLDEFNTLLDNPNISDGEIQQFMQTSGVDSTRIATETMLRFRDLYLGFNRESGHE